MATTRDPETFSRLDAPFAVGEWEVHARSNEIRRGTRRIKLEPKVMQVLCFLAARPGTVVSREELEAEAWPGMVVTYDAVTSAIIKLRKALGDEARHPRYIETLSKSGYRLIAEVRGGVQDPPDLPAGRAARAPWPIALRSLAAFVVLGLIAVWLLPNGGDPTVSDGGGTVPTSDHIPGIAVLPFVNLGAVPEQDYFADGMTEDLITDLSKLSGLWVVARNSAFAYRGGTESEPTIARELGVDYVLKGSLQRSADRIRINVRLVDGLCGSNLWAERYDRQIDDLFALQDEIAASILSAIEVEIAPSDRARLGRSHLASIEAYDAFLRGLDHYGRRSLQDTQMAIDHYRRAIAIDPEFARAYAGLALVYVRDAVDGWDLGAEDGLAKAEELIARARALDRMIPQVYFVQGQIDLYRRNYGAAIRSAEEAISIKPNYADAYAGILNSKILGSKLINSAKTIKLDLIRENLENRYETLGMEATIPDFEKYVYQFIDSTDFEFTGFIEYPISGNHGLNVLDKEKIEYSPGKNSMIAILPKGTSLKVKISGKNWYIRAFQENTGWSFPYDGIFYSQRTGVIDYEINLQSDYYYIDSTTINLDTVFVKTSIIVYENEADTPTWTKEITVN